jgi:hypothetical protein
MVVVSSDVRHARLAQCHACEQYRCGFCSQCGCWMAAKATLAMSTCPLDRWTDPENDRAEGRAP